MDSLQTRVAVGGPYASPHRGSSVVLGAFFLILALVHYGFAPVAANAQEAVQVPPITDVDVIYHPSDSTIQCPSGFTRYERDLNQGAGGDYIYLCYRKGLGAPITGLDVQVTSDANPPLMYDVWRRVDVDLNRGASGFYVFLWYTRAPDCTAIREVHVRVDNYNPRPAGYTEIPFDLNRGTPKHDRSLFLSYLKN